MNMPHLSAFDCRSTVFPGTTQALWKQFRSQPPGLNGSSDAMSFQFLDKSTGQWSCEMPPGLGNSFNLTMGKPPLACLTMSRHLLADWFCMSCWEIFDPVYSFMNLYTASIDIYSKSELWCSTDNIVPTMSTECNQTTFSNKWSQYKPMKKI